jgi:hypothetical protein
MEAFNNADSLLKVCKAMALTNSPLIPEFSRSSYPKVSHIRRQNSLIRTKWGIIRSLGYSALARRSSQLCLMYPVYGKAPRVRNLIETLDHQSASR